MARDVVEAHISDSSCRKAFSLTFASSRSSRIFPLVSLLIFGASQRGWAGEAAGAEVVLDVAAPSWGEAEASWACFGTAEADVADVKEEVAVLVADL